MIWLTFFLTKNKKKFSKFLKEATESKEDDGKPKEEDFVFVLNEKNFDNFVNNNEFTVGKIFNSHFCLTSSKLNI